MKPVNAQLAANRKDPTGRQFGRLTVLRVNGRNRWGERLVECLCECGIIKTVVFKVLLRGETRSCRCLLRESAGDRARTHGLSKTAIYRTWRNMLNRCRNPKVKCYADYGAKGITVCDEWLTFAGFFKDMGQIPFSGATIERKDNALGYSKDNCTWADRTTQAHNRSCAKWVTHQGKTLHLTDWAKLLGMKQHTLYARIFTYNWSVERAFTEPKRNW